MGKRVFALIQSFGVRARARIQVIDWLNVCARIRKLPLINTAAYAVSQPVANGKLAPALEPGALGSHIQ